MVLRDFVNKNILQKQKMESAGKSGFHVYF